MVFFVVEDAVQKTVRDIIGWHVGEKLLSEHKQRIQDDLVTVQADGDELEYIRRMFPALTPIGSRVALWQQPFAQLIADNIGA